MGHFYEVGVQSASLTTTGMIVAIVAGTGTRCELRELQVNTVINGSSATIDVGLGVPSGAGTGTLTGSVVQPLDPNDVAGSTTLTTAFGTAAPTVTTTIWMRRLRINSGIVAGGSSSWVWEPDEFVLGAAAHTSQVVLWAIAGLNAATTFNCYIKVYE